MMRSNEQSQLAPAMVDMEQTLSELLSEKEFLGTEFLTWLWWKSEASGGVFHVKGMGDVGIRFVKHIQVESGSKDSRERVSCSGKMVQMKEARLGLIMGKKVTRARLVVETGDITLEATINAATLDVQSLKIMRGFDNSFETDGGADARQGVILYRLSWVRGIRHMVHEIFLQFIARRMDDDAWSREKGGLREWILGQGRQGLFT